MKNRTIEVTVSVVVNADEKDSLREVVKDIEYVFTYKGSESNILAIDLVDAEERGI